MRVEMPVRVRLRLLLDQSRSDKLSCPLVGQSAEQRSEGERAKPRDVTGVLWFGLSSMQHWLILGGRSAHRMGCLAVRRKTTRSPTQKE